MDASSVVSSRPLVDGLTAIREFLQDNRGEVVTIIFESYVTAEEVAAAFAESGLAGLVHAQAPGTAWPPLREMIDGDQRLVAFTDDDGGRVAPHGCAVSHDRCVGRTMVTVPVTACAPGGAAGMSSDWREPWGLTHPPRALRVSSSRVAVEGTKPSVPSSENTPLTSTMTSGNCASSLGCTSMQTFPACSGANVSPATTSFGS